MATRVELPLKITKDALQQAISLRTRQKNAASNELIRKALEDEILSIQHAVNSATETK